jgi:hypothetical protein
MNRFVAVLFLVSSVFGGQRYFHNDSVGAGSGIDLDSGKIKGISFRETENPYLRTYQGGGMNNSYDSTAQYDISWLGKGTLTTCTCDDKFMSGYFPGFCIKREQEGILSLRAIDTLNQSIVARPQPNSNKVFQYLHVPFAIGSHHDSINIYSCLNNPDVSRLFLVKTNKSNWAVVRALRLIKVKDTGIFGDCTYNPPVTDCFTKIELEWWVCDDGAIDFNLSTLIRSAGPAVRPSKKTAFNDIPRVNLRGQTIKNSGKLNAFERIKSGIVGRK